MNANCAACRLAKTKCDRVQSTCARCSRLGIACVYDERRSRWDAGNVKMKTPPAAVAQDPAYAALALSLAKFKPGVRCFRARIFEHICQLVDLAIQKDDAVAISWATTLMHEHGFVPSDFPAFRRDSGTTVLDVDEAVAADASFGFAPALALAFHGTHPAFGWVQVGNLEKQVMANARVPCRRASAAGSTEPRIAGRTLRCASCRLRAWGRAVLRRHRGGDRTNSRARWRWGGVSARAATAPVPHARAQRRQPLRREALPPFHRAHAHPHLARR